MFKDLIDKANIDNVKIINTYSNIDLNYSKMHYFT